MPDSTSAHRTPFLFIHGGDDDMITPREFFESENWFRRHFGEHPVTAEVYPGRGHTFLRGQHVDEMRVFYSWLADWLWGCGRRAQRAKDARAVEAGAMMRVD